MTTQQPDRVTLRRETHDLNESLDALAVTLDAVDPAAAAAVRRARSGLFEAWTILCAPPADDEDH